MTSARFQIVVFVVVVVLSVVVSKMLSGVPAGEDAEGGESVSVSTNRAAVAGSMSFDRTSLAGVREKPTPEASSPRRTWEVLDPPIGAEAVLVQSLDASYSFLNYRTYVPWPLASLTKLIAAVVVVEDIGLDKKIPISETAVGTEGESGDLESGEVYTARDLMKIMLLVSSNDAAAAFEEYAGGRDAFVRLMTKKMELIDMPQTIVHDASGLSSANESTASDLLKLARYIAERHPDIFSWSRLQTFTAQPINEPEGRSLTNINPFVTDRDFLGGKTGTSDDAHENLLALFSLKNMRVVFIVLGSTDRIQETQSLREWVEKAYIFN